MNTWLCFHGSLIDPSEFSVLLCIQQWELVVNVQNNPSMISFQVWITCCLSWAEAFLWMEPSAWWLRWTSLKSEVKITDEVQMRAFHPDSWTGGRWSCNRSTHVTRLPLGNGKEKRDLKEMNIYLVLKLRRAFLSMFQIFTAISDIYFAIDCNRGKQKLLLISSF